MNARLVLVSILLIVGLASAVRPQDTIGREEVTATLQQQLSELESKETELRLRLEALDEQLKPENIEWAVAGIGSTRPEELREYRRKLLTIERAGIQTQLNLLEQDRVRINAAIVVEEYAVYLTYALPSPTPSVVTATSGTLRGAIIAKGPDAQSHNIPAASLRLKGVDQLIEASSNDLGEYEFANLSTGEYTLEVSAQGYKTVTTSVTIRAGETLIENVTLEVADIQEPVKTPPLKNERSSH